MEVENILHRPGCEVLTRLFTDPLNIDEAWDRGFIKGALFALLAANAINKEEHDALIVLRGLRF